MVQPSPLPQQPHQIIRRHLYAAVRTAQKRFGKLVFFNYCLSKPTFALNNEPMSELLLKLPEEQLPFFLELLERLHFVEIEFVNGKKLSKKQFLDDFEASIEEANSHFEEKHSLAKIETVLDGI